MDAVDRRARVREKNEIGVELKIHETRSSLLIHSLWGFRWMRRGLLSVSQLNYGSSSRQDELSECRINDYAKAHRRKRKETNGRHDIDGHVRRLTRLAAAAAASFCCCKRKTIHTNKYESQRPSGGWHRVTSTSEEEDALFLESFFFKFVRCCF